MQTLISLAIMILVTAGNPEAQQAREVLRGRDRLRGVSAVSVSIEKLVDHDQRCGLTENSVRLSASKTLLDSGLKIVDDVLAPELYIQITTLYFDADSLCVSKVDVDLDVLVDGRPMFPRDNVLLTGTLNLIAKGVLLSSTRQSHDGRVRSYIADKVTEIATEIRLANQ